MFNPEKIESIPEKRGDRTGESAESFIKERFGRKKIVDHYETREILALLERYRKFILDKVQKRFGQKAAQAYELISDILGDDEIIARAIGNQPFGPDVIFYKF